MKRLIIFITSILGWFIIIYLIIPLITAIAWIFWSLFIYKKLFIKEEFKGTIYVFFLLLIISLIYFIVLKAWAKYNYKKYYLKNKRNIIPIKNNYERLDIKKIEYSGEEIDELIKIFCNKNNT
ncbi:MAG: poly-beta-1,6-N-acetyl-D-glucosamine biosynthesis protein PgaD [Caldisericia bacterium]|jgi:poly-beta-1,6-N-acetyl-D-glucosamine biosynthesis protein PgaD|nr:poly-beta-1,6-N-acetyl-D-glucosamine biosynthesis protein PgaD [Caldisericia bacterium]